MKIDTLRLLTLGLLSILCACSEKPIDVTGQIFVVTQGRENIEMGAVEVLVFPDAEFQSMARATVPWMQDEARNHAQSTIDSALMTEFIREVLAMEEAAPAPIEDFQNIRRDIVDESRMANKTVQSALSQSLESGIRKLTSGAKSTVSVSTDADGRFTTQVKGKTWFLATAERKVGDETEKYIWVKGFEPPEGIPNPTLNISNECLLESNDELYSVLSSAIGIHGDLDAFRNVEISKEMTSLVAKYREAATTAKAKANRIADETYSNACASMKGPLVDFYSLHANGMGYQKSKVKELIDSGGKVVGWGGNYLESIHQDDHVEHIPADKSDFVAISSGDDYTIALRKNGQVVALGDDKFLGKEGAFSNSISPSRASSVLGISGGGRCFALDKDFRLLSWGSTIGYEEQPRPNAENIVSVASGSFHAIALKKDGTILTFGSMDEDRYKPMPLIADQIVAIDAGYEHCLALTKNGKVFAWGNNFSGNCEVPADLDDVIAIAAGQYFNLALQRNGKIVTWGNNEYGQCNVPVSASDVAAISAGLYHGIALTKAGEVICWGRNDSGQCDVPDRLGDVAAIEGGEDCTFVITIPRN